MTKPVNIYWLIDTRPETIAAGHHSGYPFYCGKTIHTPEKRLGQHLAAAWRYPNKKLSKRLRVCFWSDNIRIDTVEVVPPSGDWEERERSWIRLLRFCFKEGNCNIADGGYHVPRWIKETVPVSKRILRKRRLIKREQEKRAERLKQYPSSRREQYKKNREEAAILVPIWQAKREAARQKARAQRQLRIESAKNGKIV